MKGVFNMKLLRHSIPMSAFFCAVLIPLSLRSQIIDSSAHGFTVRTTVIIAAAPEKVYQDLVKHVGQWWSSRHSYSGDARNFSIDDKAGGCFCEKLKNGGSVLHMTVAYADPGRALRMIGGLGPLQALAVNGSLTWEMKKKGEATELDVTYAVGGYSPGGLGSMAIPVDNVLREQVMRFKRFIETGKPE